MFWSPVTANCGIIYVVALGRNNHKVLRSRFLVLVRTNDHTQLLELDGPFFSRLSIDRRRTLVTTNPGPIGWLSRQRKCEKHNIKHFSIKYKKTLTV